MSLILPTLEMFDMERQINTITIIIRDEYVSIYRPISGTQNANGSMKL